MNDQESIQLHKRIELHEKLCSILGSRNVYYQDPGEDKMIFPAIVYDLASIQTLYADNKAYKNDKCYQIKVIQPDPDTPFVDDILSEFLKVRFERRYKSNNQYHDVFNIWW